MASSSLSFTRPIPGTLRMERSRIKSLITFESKSSWNWPFGLFCVFGLEISWSKSVTTDLIGAYLQQINDFDEKKKSKRRRETYLCKHLNKSIEIFERLDSTYTYFVRSDASTDCQFRLMKHGISHLLHTFFCRQAVFFTIRRDTALLFIWPIIEKEA